MIAGIGIDLCEISRMEKLLENDRFLMRYFSDEEQQYILEKGKTKPIVLFGQKKIPLLCRLTKIKKSIKKHCF